jgi:alkyl sulfatase BDS1-like metallo-beta-lactamase superfamily hydrolase
LRRFESEALKLTGKREAFSEFVGMLYTFPFRFNIVT